MTRFGLWSGGDLDVGRAQRGRFGDRFAGVAGGLRGGRRSRRASRARPRRGSRRRPRSRAGRARRPRSRLAGAFDHDQVSAFGHSSSSRPACLMMLTQVFGCKDSEGLPAIVTYPGRFGCRNWRWLPRVCESSQPGLAVQSPRTSVSAWSRSRSSLALRRPTELPRRSGVMAVVCSTRTRVAWPSSSIVGRNVRAGADREVGATSTVLRASSSSACTITANRCPRCSVPRLARGARKRKTSPLTTRLALWPGRGEFVHRRAYAEGFGDVVRVGRGLFGLEAQCASASSSLRGFTQREPDRVGVVVALVAQEGEIRFGVVVEPGLYGPGHVVECSTDRSTAVSVERWRVCWSDLCPGRRFREVRSTFLWPLKLADDVPAEAFERADELSAGDDRQAAQAGGQLAAQDAGVDRAALFAEAFDVQLERFAGVLDGVVERVALGVRSGQVGGVDVVAALVLRREDELDFPRLGDEIRIRPRGGGYARPPVLSSASASSAASAGASLKSPSDRSLQAPVGPVGVRRMRADRLVPAREDRTTPVTAVRYGRSCHGARGQATGGAPRRPRLPRCPQLTLRGVVAGSARPG